MTHQLLGEARDRLWAAIGWATLTGAGAAFVTFVVLSATPVAQIFAPISDSRGFWAGWAAAISAAAIFVYTLAVGID